MDGFFKKYCDCKIDKYDCNSYVVAVTQFIWANEW